jgi:hypothetical protein
MFNSKFLFTLIGIMVALFAIFNMNIAKSPVISNEGFAGLSNSFTWKVDREVASSREAAAKGDLYSIPGTYQAILNPRFSNVNYGANIKYNMPSYQNQAVPCDPLTFGNMAKENYTRENFVKEDYGCGTCNTGVVSCRKGGEPLSYHGGAPETIPNYAAGNYNDVLDAVYNSQEYPDTDALVPIGDMTTVNALGETIQPVVYDRYIFANRNSRLRSRGDPIRGDLPIVPCAAEWFRPSVHPNIDLQEGAMNVMGGVGNDTANALSDLIYTSSGGGLTTIGGVNMANMFNSSLSGGMRDVQMTAYP